MKATGAMRALIIDGNTARRGMVSSVLNRQPDMLVAGEVGTPEEALQLLNYAHPDVAFVDLDSLGDRMVPALCAMRGVSPDTAIVAMCRTNDEDTRATAERVGVVGTVSKPVEPLRLVSELRRVVTEARSPDTTSDSLRVLLASADPALPDALAECLQLDGHALVAETRSLSGLVSEYAELQPDLTILDTFPSMGDEMQAARCLGGLDPRVRILVSAAPSDLRAAANLIAAGASGPLLKPLDPDRTRAEVARVARLPICATVLNTPPCAAENGKASPWRPRVLVIEDQAMMRRALEKVITALGCDLVGEADSAAEGRDMAAARQPDLVLLDVHLPDGSGLDVLRHLRVEQPAMRVIMITGDAQQDTVRSAAAAGANGYVLKPFRLAKVAEEIQRVLGRA